MLKAFLCPLKIIITQGSKVPPGNLGQVTNSFRIYLGYVTYSVMSNTKRFNMLAESHGLESLQKTTLRLLGCFDFNISLYVCEFGRIKGRKEEESSQTNS